MQIEQFARALSQRGITFGAGVPCSYFTPLVNYMAAEPSMTYFSAASEGEAVAIAAGLCAAGRPAFALMQNSGLGNAVNPITSLLVPYSIPATLLVSHRGEPGRPDEPQHGVMGQITEQLAELCQLRTHVLADDAASFETELAAAQDGGGPTAWICRKGRLEGGPDAPTRAFELASGTYLMPEHGSFAPEIKREQALRALLPLLNGDGADDLRRPAVVSTTGKTSRELYELDDRGHDKDNRFYMVGSMGCAAAFGLGVAQALAARDDPRHVVVIDGDGSLLMKMGTLATIGALRPLRLHHIVLDNGAHDSTGGQHTASPHVDFAAVALACGYRQAETWSTERDFVAAAKRQLRSDGPTFLRMAIETGARSDLGRPTLTPADGYKRFSAFLAQGQP